MKELHKIRMASNMVMLTDANGLPSASDKITKTELNMLNNVRANIQTQIDTINNNITAAWVKSLIDNRRPDYANMVDISTCITLNGTGGSAYTTPSAGWLQITYDFYGTSGASWRILENGYVMWQEKELSDQGYNAQIMKLIPVANGVNILVDQTKSNTVTCVSFIPVTYDN